MANEIRMQASLSCKNGNVDVRRERFKLVDQAVAGGPSPGVVQVGTSEETVLVSELTTLGVAHIVNLDPTNYVRMGFSTGVYGIRLMPGEPNQFRLNPGITIYVIANSATCRVEFSIMEN